MKKDEDEKVVCENNKRDNARSARVSKVRCDVVIPYRRRIEWRGWIYIDVERKKVRG